MADVDEVIRWHERIARESIYTPIGEQHERFARAIREMREERDRLRDLLRPFAHFAEQWDRNPLRGIDESQFYTIHAGEDEAVLNLADFRVARRALSPNDREAE